MSIYEQLKKNRISTLEIHRLLTDANVEIPQRTLHTYLQSDLENCKDARIEKVVKFIIKQKEQLISDVKKLVTN